MVIEGRHTGWARRGGGWEARGGRRRCSPIALSPSVGISSDPLLHRPRHPSGSDHRPRHPGIERRHRRGLKMDKRASNSVQKCHTCVGHRASSRRYIGETILPTSVTVLIGADQRPFTTSLALRSDIRGRRPACRFRRWSVLQWTLVTCPYSAVSCATIRRCDRAGGAWLGMRRPSVREMSSTPPLPSRCRRAAHAQPRCPR